MATKRMATKPTAGKPATPTKPTTENSPTVSFPTAKAGAAASPTDETERSRSRSRQNLFSRSVALPAAGIGLVTLILAMQENASFPVAGVVGVAVTFVVIGMIALKRAFYGD